MIRDVWDLKRNKYGEILGYVYFDHDVCGEWEKKWKMYGDVNKKVKENECVYKNKEKKYKHKIWVEIVLQKKK